MKNFLSILFLMALMLSFTSCNLKEISVLRTQLQDMKIASEESSSKIKQLEDIIIEKDIEINRLNNEIAKRNITLDDQKQVEQLIKEYFTDLEKKDYSSAWELTSSEQKKIYNKENAIKEHWGVETIKLISMKGYLPPQLSATGDVPPNSPTVWFSVTFDIEPSPNTGWSEGLDERFVNVVKEIDGKWRIDGLATSP